MEESLQEPISNIDWVEKMRSSPSFYRLVLDAMANSQIAGKYSMQVLSNKWDSVKVRQMGSSWSIFHAAHPFQGRGEKIWTESAAEQPGSSLEAAKTQFPELVAGESLSKSAWFTFVI